MRDAGTSWMDAGEAGATDAGHAVEADARGAGCGDAGEWDAGWAS